jgi:drug/metabolite transporter (DMT)-like permease
MTPHRLGLLLLMMTAVNWGATWPLMKFLLTELPPLTMRAIGTGTLAVLLAGGALAFGVKLHVPREQRPRLILFALLNITAWMAFGTLSLRWLTASEAAILAYTMPVWAALFAWPILGERPGPRRIAGLILGFGSILILFAGRGVELGLAKLPGLLFILASALLFALGAVLSKRRPLVLHPITALAWQMAIGCLPMAILAPLLESFEPRLVTPPVWFWFGWFMVFSMGVSYLTWFGALARLPASTAAIGTLLAPVLSVLGAGLILGEPLGWREVAALSGTVLAVALAVGVRDKPP